MSVARHLSSALVSLVALVVAGLAVAAPAWAQSTTLRVSLPISPASPTGQNVLEFARQVQARTAGAVRIEIDQTRGYGEHEVLGAVAAGAVEIGVTALNQFSNPLTRAFLQPFLFNFDALAQAATSPESEIRRLIEKEILATSGARVLWWQPYGSSVIVSRKFSAANPAGIAAHTIGATDDQTVDLLRICSGTPRRVSPADVFSGLKNGPLQAAVVDLMNVGEHDLWRVADTMTVLRHTPSVFMIVISETAWQRLTPEQREIVTELAEDAQAYMWARFVTIRAEAYAFAAGKGMRIVLPSNDDIEAWRACSAPLLESYLERAGEDGARLFMAYGKLRTAPCCLETPSFGPARRQ